MRSRVICIAFVFLVAVYIAHAQDDAPSWCVAAWYPSSEHPEGFTSLTDHLDALDVVHPFWYSPAPDGSLIAHDGAEDAEKLAAWREAGVLIIPSIFGSVPEMLATPDAIETHIGEIVALIERMEYDGIDIDYEGFPANTREAFSVFIEGLSAALHERGLLLTIAVHAKTDDAGMWEGAAAQDWARITAAVDVFTIMTYDYTNRNQPPGPIAPTAWVLDVLEYAESVTDLRQVRMGLPFYGYGWVRGNPPATTTTWESTQRLVEAFDITIQRDPADQEARIEVDVPRVPDQTIYVSDAESLAFKMEQVMADFPNLGGVSIWGLGGEDPANWDVLARYDLGECAFSGQ